MQKPVVRSIIGSHDESSDYLNGPSVYSRNCLHDEERTSNDNAGFDRIQATSNLMADKDDQCTHNRILPGTDGFYNGTSSVDWLDCRCDLLLDSLANWTYRSQFQPIVVGGEIRGWEHIDRSGER